MFCSGCGSEIQVGLNYCSRCGRRVTEENYSTSSLAANLTTAVGYIGASGFFGFIFVVLILARYGVPANQMVPIAIFYFAALFGICFMILRQAAVFAGGESKSSTTERIQPEQQAYLRPQTTAQLEEPIDYGVGSVTDHTTRTLDKVPVERN